MALLAALSNLNGSERGRAALGIVLQRSKILRLVEQRSAFELDATKFQFQAVTGSGNLQARPIGGGYDGTAKAPPDPVNGMLAIYGDKILIDRTHRDDAANGLRNIDRWLETEAQVRMRHVAGGLDNAVMNHDGTNNTMKGLARILNGTDLPGFAGQTRVINAKTAGGVAGDSFYLCADATDAQFDLFIEALTRWLKLVPDATGIVMNTTLAGRFTTIARRRQLLGQGFDLFGNPVDTFNRIPIIEVSDQAISDSEPDDKATAPPTNTTSLYIERLGEHSTSLVTNSGLYYKEWDVTEDLVSSQEEFEIRLAWKIEDPESILRVRNIRVK